MKFGICIDKPDRENLLELKAAGADYIELNFKSFADKSEKEVKALASLLSEVGIPCLSYNCMLADGLRVSGKDKNFAAARDFVRKIFDKVSILDARTVVFGSKPTRFLDGDNTKENGMLELTAFLHDYISPLCREYGFICTVEPLSECNLVHTLDDALSLVKAVNTPEISMLADFYHVMLNEEKHTDLSEYAPYLRHTHIASAKADRAYPHADDGEDYSAIFGMLRECGYSYNMSIEGRSRNTGDRKSEYAEAFDILRKAADGK